MHVFLILAIGQPALLDFCIGIGYQKNPYRSIAKLKCSQHLIILKLMK